jgi:anti-anti-sigma regulatory factor
MLWCTKRVEQDLVFLDAIPQSTAEIADVAQVGKSLQRLGNVHGVVVNMSAMDTVNSSFVAGLLVLRRLVETAGGSLTLYEVPPHIHAILERLQLHTLFVIKGAGQDLLSPT